ncbi:MAG: class I SAM-dependent methyltransferase [Nitrospirota bacterium]
MPIEEEGYPSTELPSFGNAPNYYAAMLEYFGPHLGGQVVEVGAGIGTFSQCLLSFPQITALTVIEPAKNLFPILRKKLSENSKVRLVNGDLQSVASSLSCDSVVLINVLEHVENDEELLSTIHQVLRPGGTVLLFVPAGPGLYGSLDEEFGHIRRYRKGELGALLTKVGFQVGCLRYFNFPGIFSWFVFGRIFKCKTLNPRSVWLYDRIFMSWIPRCERIWEPVLGQSVLAVCTKPQKGNN